MESPRFDLRPGLPDLSLFPRRAWMQSVRRSLIEAPTGTFDYPDSRARNRLARPWRRI